MNKSLISDVKECLICRTTMNLHKHHIFYGTANRPKSEKYGCWCWLCGYHHNMSDYGVHFDKRFDKDLKEYCQREWEKEYGTREDFMRIFGRNYLD